MLKCIVFVMVNVVLLCLELYSYYSFHDTLGIFEIVAISYWFGLVWFTCKIFEKNTKCQDQLQ
ncbi:MAG: hypothetical protein KDH96_02750 [Candidatus Riesia sp.]|nr:hypothetical protein [Candidatus Riesia sp.]